MFRRRAPALVLAVLTLLPVVVAGTPVEQSTPSDISAEGGGGYYGGTTTYASAGPSYQAWWNGETFTEVTNPLARFRKFQLTDPESDGIAVLTPMGRPSENGASPDPMMEFSNADVEAAMNLLVVTRSQVRDAAFAAIQDIGALSEEESQEILDHIMGGRWSDAVRLLRDWAAVSVNCGPNDPFVYEWVMAVPMMIDCDRVDAIDELAMQVVPMALGWDVVANPEGPATEAANHATLKMAVASGDVTAPNAPFVVGFAYAGFGVGMTVAPSKLAAITLEIHNFGTDLHDTGSVTFDAPPAFPFPVGQAYHFTLGNDVSRDVSVSPTSGESTSRLRFTFESGVYAGVRKLALTPERETHVDAMTLHAEFAPRELVRVEHAFVDSPFAVGVSEDVATGSRVLYLEENASQGNRRGELRGTWWDAAGVRTAFQVAGIPAAMAIGLDAGTLAGDGAGIGSLDIRKGGPVAGYFRAFVVDGRLPQLNWNATIGDAGRFQQVAAFRNPESMEEPLPLMIEAVHFDTVKGTAKTVGRLASRDFYNATLAGVAPTETEPTTWTMQAPCADACTGQLDRGIRERAAGYGRANASFVAISSMAYAECVLVDLEGRCA